MRKSTVDNMMSQAELMFGLLGYNRRENKNGSVIVYYKVKNGVEFDDITFCKASKKIIFYQGDNYGPSEYRMDYRLLKAILYQCNELGWRFSDGENIQNSEKQNKM